MDQSPDSFVIMDRELRYLYVNKAAELRCGRTLGDLRGVFAPGALNGGVYSIPVSEYRDILREGKPRSYPRVLPRGPFGDKVFHVRMFPVGDGIGQIWSDVTEVARAEASLLSAREELRALAAHLVEAREDERKGIARELHDELGQDLTAIEMELRSVGRAGAAMSDEARRRIGEAIQLTNHSIRSIQRICSELRPSVLDKLGLKAAIEWLAEDHSARAALIVRTDLSFRDELVGPKASTALFRIAQESLRNVVRHAQAASADISLRDEGGAIVLSIVDDGLGISDEQARGPEAFGIRGMEERIFGLGGSLSIRGRPGRGTSVVTSLPIPPEGRLP